VRQLLKENERLLNGRNIDSLNVTENSRYIENLHIISLIDQDILKVRKKQLTGSVVLRATNSM
jgi:hypothetical protein